MKVNGESPLLFCLLFQQESVLEEKKFPLEAIFFPFRVDLMSSFYEANRNSYIIFGKKEA